MEQIKSDQVVPAKVAENTVVSIPRDLGQIIGDKRKSLGFSDVQTRSDNTTPIGTTPDIPSSIDPIDIINQPTNLPGTPQLKSIKSQTISINPDGTASVDIIIEVEDISNAIEYEVRITKGAGNL